jgi:hypothetical protein
MRGQCFCLPYSSAFSVLVWLQKQHKDHTCRKPEHRLLRHTWFAALPLRASASLWNWAVARALDATSLTPTRLLTSWAAARVAARRKGRWTALCMQAKPEEQGALSVMLQTSYKPDTGHLYLLERSTCCCKHKLLQLQSLLHM